MARRVRSDRFAFEGFLEARFVQTADLQKLHPVSRRLERGKLRVEKTRRSEITEMVRNFMAILQLQASILPYKYAMKVPVAESWKTYRQLSNFWTISASHQETMAYSTRITRLFPFSSRPKAPSTTLHSIFGLKWFPTFWVCFLSTKLNRYTVV